jgi:hypothetical protein
MTFSDEFLLKILPEWIISSKENSKRMNPISEVEEKVREAEVPVTRRSFLESWSGVEKYQSVLLLM